MRHGFSLVELSIVLVILGLLTGGILAGQNLIRAAELRSVIKKVDQFEGASLQFIDRYFHLPGDMPNATDFWPDCVDGVESPCNGTGNGRIQSEPAHRAEHLRFWQHLALSGMISGDYPGFADTQAAGGPCQAIRQCVISGQTAPAGAGQDSFMTVWPNWGSPNSHVTLFFYSMHSDPSTWDKGHLTAEEAYSIDRKLDDGVASSGVVGSRSTIYFPSWAGGDCLASGEYNLESGDGCYMYKHMSF